jgi:hypothetical protein
VSKLDDADKIVGPEGVGEEASAARREEKLQKWRNDVAKEYLSHFPNFRLESVLPENPSRKQRRTAEKVSRYLSYFQTLT